MRHLNARKAFSLCTHFTAIITIVLFFVSSSRAGGPDYVAGANYFQTNAMGQPLTWSQGQIDYYTDQGDLSPILPNAAANALVADAFSQWTSVPTAAVSATAAGQLAEDVNGTNIAVNAAGAITAPPDIMPSATGTPVGIVYDYDGSVTDALLGTGAGDPSQCFYNAVFGGSDNFGSEANFQHALVVMNGQCVQQSSQLTDMEYRLVRVLGEVLGVGWSQLNLNVITGNPAATSDDYAGFPVMHAVDPLNCVPITSCYANPYQLSIDDQAAISRLYPVTAHNLANFPGKQIFSSATVRIYGSVWFSDEFGNPTQPMQGVNVVARLVDPITGKPSRRYAASAVSGFLFTGSAGNAITGLTDALGIAYDQWGSTNPGVEGFFDLAGLQLPSGATSGQFQISVEAVNPQWSDGVNPYNEFQVEPSGIFQPMVLAVELGGDTEQDIVMTGGAQPMPQWAKSETWSAPAAIPLSGDWIGGLNSYGEAAYFSLPAKANRTVSVAVTALDETGMASQSKSAPVIGMWSLGDPQGMPPPALTTAPFNQTTFGLTRLDALISESSNFLIGIADLRGDGRPDYHYHAHVLYGDSISPPRVSVSGNAITVNGIGFAPGLAVSVGNVSATPLAINAGRMVFSAPTLPDGVQNVTIIDPITGAFSIMTEALTFGAAASDNIVLLPSANSPTPVGTQAVHPVSVRVVASDGVTPVSGATVGWSASNSAALSVCGGASSCSAITDESGLASTWVTPAMSGAITITATLAPGIYNPPKSVATTVSGTESALDIGVTTPYLWIAQGATISLPLTARVLSNGVPQSGATVNFTLSGPGSLSALSAQTNSNGYVTVNIALTQFSTAMQVSACVAPENTPCQNIYANPVSTSLQNLQAVAGARQAATQGHIFQPLVVRVTDSSSPPNPVVGAAVTFQTTVMRGGNSDTGNPAAPAVLSVSQATAQSDGNGLASVQPSAGSFTGALQVMISVTAGANAWLESVLQMFPPIAETGSPTGRTPSTVGLLPDPIRRFWPIARE